MVLADLLDINYFFVYSESVCWTDDVLDKMRWVNGL